MMTPDRVSLVKAALFALAEIEAATDAFGRGDDNAFDALDAIVVAIEAYRPAGRSSREAAEGARQEWLRGTIGDGVPLPEPRDPPPSRP